ncbi:hypothetical protein NERG_01225 [Nematocida ausubeli]|uniref:Uncharacterized protein n=1 Tax=Nematocida ausubeli (strain ATCC PRA-371 / ERTm2) TaxID=1913371 RepID=H8ZBY2_NEMA1|nr:hypothetical protein NERG_01225 [Nematocida ausubeli]
MSNAIAAIVNNNNQNNRNAGPRIETLRCFIRTDSVDREEMRFSFLLGYIYIWMVQIILCILLNSLAGKLLAREWLFDENDPLSRTLTSLAFAWLFTMIYLIVTPIMQYIAGFHLVSGLTRIIQAWMPLIIIVFSIIAIGLGISLEVPQSGPMTSMCVICTEYIVNLVYCCYVCAVLNIIGAIFIMHYHDKLEYTHKRTGTNVFPATCAAFIIILGSGAFIYGCYNFSSQLYIDCPNGFNKTMAICED